MPYQKCLTNSAGDRDVDDWQPRANLRSLFKEGKINLEDTEGIREFSQKFCVQDSYVNTYIQHLQDLKILQGIRANNRKESSQQRQQKAYKDYDWKELVINGRLGKLLVSELDKYLCEHNLNKSGNKGDKVAAISCHFMRSLPHQGRVAVRQSAPVSDTESECSDSEAEIVLLSDSNMQDQNESSDSEAEYHSLSKTKVQASTESSDTEAESESSSESNTPEETDSSEAEDIVVEVTQTRSGRKAGTWRNTPARLS